MGWSSPPPPATLHSAKPVPTEVGYLPPITHRAPPCAPRGRYRRACRASAVTVQSTQVGVEADAGDGRSPGAPPVPPVHLHGTRHLRGILHCRREVVRQIVHVERPHLNLALVLPIGTLSPRPYHELSTLTTPGHLRPRVHQPGALSRCLPARSRCTKPARPRPCSRRANIGHISFTGAAATELAAVNGQQ